MLAEAQEKTDTTSSGFEEDLDHYYCGACHPDGDRALCSTDISDAKEIEDEEFQADCIVCHFTVKCPECGVDF